MIWRIRSTWAALLGVEEHADDYPVYIVADRAFSFLVKIAELAKIGVCLITPYKRNMKDFRLLRGLRW
ncbi:MAG: hypothetical protein ACP6IP_07530 [Candidatus Njordarchaeia archaeon]